MVPSIVDKLICSEGSRRLTMVVAAIGFLAIQGCQKPPPVTDMGSAAEAGGMSFTVLGYSIVRPEITSEEGVYEYSKPVLAITMRAKNVGKDSFRYVPVHGGRQMTEASSPLLYFAPGDNEPLPPKKKSPLKGVVLDEGSLEGQVTSAQRLAPGDTVTDRYLFEPPSEKKADLIFSIPPTMHRGEKPVLHRMSYSYKQPQSPPIRQLGETVSLDGVGFSVNSAKLEYVKLEGSGDSTGYSTNPLFKVAYSINNTSEQPITFRPGHRAASGPRPPALYIEGEQQKTVARVKFSSNLSPVGQVDGTKTIEPGEEVEDFALFENPGSNATSLRFEFPAARIGRTGLLRYQVPFKDQKAPEPPEELEKELDEGSEDSEEG